MAENSSSRNAESVTIMGGVQEPEITAAQVRIVLTWRERVAVATCEALAELRQSGCDPDALLQRLPSGSLSPLGLPRQASERSQDEAALNRSA